ncbi:MAG: TauD/TfdA family dioxygenase [Chloroflexi bacterium]|nr:MAG: TauD/TfdA family dioxygenase [Chloroflexota bacterium]
MEKKASLESSLRKSIQRKRGVNLASWAGNNKDYLEKALAKHGALLFRNFSIDAPAKFEAFARAVSANGELFDDYGDLPREELGAKVYGSTPYPADKAILFHNEGSHIHRWPMKIFFYCIKAAEKQGATPLLDCRKIYQAIDPAIIARMTEKKLMYVRNFISGLDVSWQHFFQTTDKKRVEDYCREAGIDFAWKEGNQLTTRQVRQAVVRHPHTGEMLFFNQIQLHHISCLDPDVRDSLLSMFREEDLPRNVYYGDGTRIEDEVVAAISEIYEQQAVRFQWQAGDVIILDNMTVAHARDPFEGTRKVLVAMAEVISQLDL